MAPRFSERLPEGREALSIDPGSKHVGLAFWLGGVPIGMATLGPDEALDLISARLASGVCTHLAYEGFRLRGGDMALRQAGSDLRVVQVIGVIKWLCRARGVEPTEVSPSDRAACMRRWQAVGAPVLKGNDHGRAALYTGLVAWHPYAAAWTPGFVSRLHYSVPLYLHS